MQLFSAFAPIYLVLKYLIIFLDAALVFIFAFAFAELVTFRPPFVLDPRRPAKRQHHTGPRAAHAPLPEEQWRKIISRLGDETPDSLRLAVIEADGFVDNMLKKKGYEGDTFADRLSQLNQDDFKTLDLVWDAHRLRNDLVHTHGFVVTPDRARKAMVNYEAFLRELGVLEKVAAAHH
jgi:hypothetical protein